MVGGCYWEGTINEEYICEYIHVCVMESELMGGRSMVDMCEYICVMESELMGGRSMVDVCDMQSNLSNWTSLN